MTKNNNERSEQFRCAVCGDAPDFGAGVDVNGSPIMGIRDNRTYGGMGPCGDLHRWVPVHKDAV